MVYVLFIHIIIPIEQARIDRSWEDKGEGKETKQIPVE